MAIYKLDLTYSDASNYKTHFEVNVNSEEHPDVAYLKAGDEFPMGLYGTLTKRTFFNSHIHPFPYDEEEDHNILEVNDIVPLIQHP